MVDGCRSTDKELKGNVAIFESNDLKNGITGKSAGYFDGLGYMCECPDVMDIEQQFLVVSCQKETG